MFSYPVSLTQFTRLVDEMPTGRLPLLQPSPVLHVREQNLFGDLHKAVMDMFLLRALNAFVTVEFVFEKQLLQGSTLHRWLACRVSVCGVSARDQPDPEL